jgi:hypothetical protein
LLWTMANRCSWTLCNTFSHCGSVVLETGRCDVV